MGKIPTVVISLTFAETRRAVMHEQLSQLKVPYVFFDAVVGAELSKEQIAQLKPRRIERANRNEWLVGELGNSASNKAVLERIVSGKDDFVCVLEDDAILSDAFPAFLDEDNIKRLPAFDVLRLNSSWKGRYLPISSFNGIQIVASYRMGPYSTGQIITRKAAKAILRSFAPMRGPFDLALYMDRRFPFLKILDVMPEVLKHDASTSFVEVDIPRMNEAPRSFFEMIQKRIFRVGFEFRTITSFMTLWGLSSRKKLLRR
jgi:GR25 family glycosyltransferase involved in LPS biosynthesis